MFTVIKLNSGIFDYYKGNKTSFAAATWTVSPQPFVKYSIGVGVEQDEDGVIGREVSLSSCAIQEQVCQVVKAPHHRVVVPLGGAVACQNSQKTHQEMNCIIESLRS